MWVLVVILLFLSAPSSEGADSSLETTFNSAASALSRGDLASAEQGFQSVLKAQPNNIGALGNLGVIYSRMGRTRDAVAVYTRALKIAPKEPGLLLNLGLAHLKEENHAAAKPLFARLLTMRPGDLRAKELLATSQVYTNEPAKALELLGTLPSSPSVLYATGLAHLKLGNRDKARQLLDDSLPAAMTPAQAAVLRGKAFYDATLFEDAIREYRMARELDPALPGVCLALARSLISARENDAAQTELRTILKQQPKDPEAAYLLGALLVGIGNEAEAEPLLEISRAARPDGWGAYFYLGRAKLQRDDAKSAVALLEKAAELNPDDATVLYQLSRALKAVG
ncbi:MAG TPA: tetratricopeptide repeat protein, partial [Bryobacteraceae bacterium]|nr:tetratricopeptide repeat protein [Bryobacteraceae bacterium]